MPAFWETTALEEMTPAQWESLCDGCGRCCLEKLEDEDTREIYYTNVACRLLNLSNGRCKDYANRSRRVPTCITLSLKDLKDPYWLPSTCAYRLLAEGQPLPVWHPLVSGDPDSLRLAGRSILGRIISETKAGDLTQHLIDWVK